MDVSIAIGMESCEAAGCDAVGEAQMLGNVLFTGAYSPTLKTGTGDLSQNFTVKVPASMATGQAVLTVAHFYLLGVRLNVEFYWSLRVIDILCRRVQILWLKCLTLLLMSSDTSSL